MKRSHILFLKVLVWIGCLLPAASLLQRAATNNLGPDPTAEIASITGLSALWLLVATLCVSPIRALSPRLSWLVQFRRLLGLLVFFYATLHMLTWLGLYAGFDLNTIETDILRRRFIIVIAEHAEFIAHRAATDPCRPDAERTRSTRTRCPPAV